MPNIVFCLPGSTFSHHFLQSWTNLITHCPQLNVTPIYRWATGSNVYQVRNHCLAGQPEKGPHQLPFQGQIDYDYIMWLDSDMVFTPDDFKNLLDQIQTNRKLHILSGLYLREGGQDYAAVTDWQSQHFETSGQPKFLTPKETRGQQNLLRVDYTGMGFMLVRQGVFEKLDYPWFQPLGLQGDSGLVGFTSEDAGFCLRASQAGFSTWVDPQIIIGHEKSTILK